MPLASGKIGIGLKLNETKEMWWVRGRNRKSKAHNKRKIKNSKDCTVPCH